MDAAPLAAALAASPAALPAALTALPSTGDPVHRQRLRAAVLAAVRGGAGVTKEEADARAGVAGDGGRESDECRR
jgi:hypothetical protein